MTIIITFLIVFFIGFQLFKQKNPYIRAHKKKWENEKHYDAYIKWLDKNGGDMPIKEVKGKEEQDLMNEINKDQVRP